MPSEAVKQVIVMRNDLNMRKGKIAAQASHASNQWIMNRILDYRPNGPVIYPLTDNDFSKAELDWLCGFYTKVVLQVGSEHELMEIHGEAVNAGFRSFVVTDLGLTEFKGVQTRTCLAIGPDYAGRIDLITGHLKLF